MARAIKMIRGTRVRYIVASEKVAIEHSIAILEERDAILEGMEAEDGSHEAEVYLMDRRLLINRAINRLLRLKLKLYQKRFPG